MLSNFDKHWQNELSQLLLWIRLIDVYWNWMLILKKCFTGFHNRLTMWLWFLRYTHWFGRNNGEFLGFTSDSRVQSKLTLDITCVKDSTNDWSCEILCIRKSVPSDSINWSMSPCCGIESYARLERRFPHYEHSEDLVDYGNIIAFGWNWSSSDEIGDNRQNLINSVEPNIPSNLFKWVMTPSVNIFLFSGVHQWHFALQPPLCHSVKTVPELSRLVCFSVEFR
jgi:hypothetical protein